MLTTGGSDKGLLRSDGSSCSQFHTVKFYLKFNEEGRGAIKQ
jgi:hypothetical protein